MLATTQSDAEAMHAFLLMMAMGGLTVFVIWFIGNTKTRATDWRIVQASEGNVSVEWHYIKWWKVAWPLWFDLDTYYLRSIKEAEECLLALLKRQGRSVADIHLTYSI